MKTQSRFRRCAFRPGGRTVNRVAVRADRNDVRQLAANGQIARKVPVDGRVMDEVGAAVFAVEDEKMRVSDLANRDLVPLWLNLAAGCEYYRKFIFGLQ